MTTKPHPEEIAKWFEYCHDTGIVKRRLQSGRWPGGVIAGSKDGSGYYSTSFNGKTIRCHIIAWVIFYGRYPNGHIDHINKIKSDNRIANLREVTQAQNSRNQKIRTNNTSGFPGVSFDRLLSKWIAYITINYKKIHIGVFKQIEDAIEARKIAAIKYFGEFSPHDWNPEEKRTK